MQKCNILRNLILTHYMFIYLLFCADVKSSEENTLSIECKKIYEVKWLYMEKGFVTCENDPSYLVINEPDLEFSEAVHSNGSKIVNSDRIEALFISTATMRFMPNGIKNFFPKLKAVEFYSCELTYLDKENMKQFGSDLEYASFLNNPISVLDGDLFEFNPNLKFISFNFCSLKFIDPGFFKNLRNLKHIEHVWMEISGCINQIYDLSDNSHNIQTFTWKDGNCTDTKERDENVKIRWLINESRRMKKGEIRLTKLENIVGDRNLTKKTNERLTNLEKKTKDSIEFYFKKINQTLHENDKKKQNSDAARFFISNLLLCYLVTMVWGYFMHEYTTRSWKRIMKDYDA